MNLQTGEFVWERPQGKEYKKKMFQIPTNT